MCSIQRVFLRALLQLEMYRDLTGNQMSGSITPELGNLSQIQTL
jgi:hypothetical protein